MKSSLVLQLPIRERLDASATFTSGVTTTKLLFRMSMELLLSKTISTTFSF